MTKQKKTVAIYARVSTDKQKVDMQIRELRQFAKRSGWTIYQEYIDQSFTGANINRPAFRKMNIFWRFPVKGGTSARPVIRSAWWNSASGSAWMSLKKCLTGILFSASRRSFAVIFFTTESFLPVSAVVPGNP